LGLLIVGAVVPGQRERRLATLAERPADKAFEDPLALRRPGQREGVLRIEPGITQDDVAFPLQLLASRLCEDFNPATALPRVLSGVRILIDLDLLDRGRTHSKGADLHAVDDNRRTTRSDRAGVKEA